MRRESAQAICGGSADGVVGRDEGSKFVYKLRFDAAKQTTARWSGSHGRVPSLQAAQNSLAGERGGGGALGPEGQQGFVVGSGDEPPLMTADRIRGGGVCSVPRAESGESFFQLAGMQDKQKGPPLWAGGPSVPPIQNGASSDRGSGGAAAGTSASARLSRRTELARTLQKMVTFAPLAFFDLPFSLSYFELTSCPSIRTWSPVWSVSAMESSRRLKATTRVP